MKKNVFCAVLVIASLSFLMSCPLHAVPSAAARCWNSSETLLISDIPYEQHVVYVQYYDAMELIGLPFIEFILYANGTRENSPLFQVTGEYIGIDVTDFVNASLYNGTFTLAAGTTLIPVPVYMNELGVANTYESEIVVSIYERNQCLEYMRLTSLLIAGLPSGESPSSQWSAMVAGHDYLLSASFANGTFVGNQTVHFPPGTSSGDLVTFGQWPWPPPPPPVKGTVTPAWLVALIVVSGAVSAIAMITALVLTAYKRRLASIGRDGTDLKHGIDGAGMAEPGRDVGP